MSPHRNNIGFLRLLFALAVVISHGPYLHFNDGFRYDPLFALTHVQKLGDVGVDAFFLISGFLITQSFERSASWRAYLAKRVLRIYPAFAVAYGASCLLAMHLFDPGYAPAFWRILVLQDPPLMAHFGGVDGYAVNLPMWTIAYEFRAYLWVLLLGIAGLLAHRRAIAALTIAMMALMTILNIPGIDWRMDMMPEPPVWADILFGRPYDFVRLNAAFLIGMCFHLYRDRLLPLLTPKRAIIHVIVMASGLFWRPTADLFLLGFGSFVLFWIAFEAKLGPLQRINDRWDLSYGVYLYGWPVTVLTVFLYPTISNWLYYPVITGASLLLGAISWFGLERHCQYRSRRRMIPPAPKSP